MAYTSVLPVHRLDRSIDYVKDRAKTTKSAGSLEEAIDYALNREKTEQTIFEDAIYKCSIYDFCYSVRLWKYQPYEYAYG